MCSHPPNGVITQRYRVKRDSTTHLSCAATVLAQPLPSSEGAELLAMGVLLSKNAGNGTSLLTGRIYCQKLAQPTEGYRAALSQLHPLIQNGNGFPTIVILWLAVKIKPRELN